MLVLKNITKVYSEGENRVEALKGIDLSFGDSEFAAILGPSGCGKTTLLNIIGGLDQYTSGDLIIRGKYTKEFREHDWDTYRNHSVGFVFQSYNLIPHQTALANVELALTLSGVSREERRRRAVEALEKVGLGDQLKKKPNQKLQMLNASRKSSKRLEQLFLKRLKDILLSVRFTVTL